MTLFLNVLLLYPLSLTANDAYRFKGRDQELVGYEYRAAYWAAIGLMDDALMVVRRLPVAVTLARATVVLAPPAGEWW